MSAVEYTRCDREALLEIEVSNGRDMLTSWVRRIREACGEER